jgi:hypothetical protein
MNEPAESIVQSENRNWNSREKAQEAQDKGFFPEMPRNTVHLQSDESQPSLPRFHSVSCVFCAFSRPFNCRI